MCGFLRYRRYSYAWWIFGGKEDSDGLISLPVYTRPSMWQRGSRVIGNRKRAISRLSNMISEHKRAMRNAWWGGDKHAYFDAFERLHRLERAKLRLEILDEYHR